MKRLFLGFAPSAEQSQKLQQLQQDTMHWGKPVATANLHMTLAFLGMVEPEAQTQCIAAVTDMVKPRFSVTLDTLSYWHKPNILCLSGNASDNNLQMMADRTQDIIKQLKLIPSEHSYTPHITLSRKASGLPKHIEVTPIQLQPTQLHLYHSHNPGSGVQYDIIQSWPLN